MTAKVNNQIVTDITAKADGKNTPRALVLKAFQAARKRTKNKKVRYVYFSTETLFAIHEFFKVDDWNIESEISYLWEAEIVLAEDYPDNKIAVIY